MLRPLMRRACPARPAIQAGRHSANPARRPAAGLRARLVAGLVGGLVAGLGSAAGGPVSSAAAIERYDVNTMTCAAVQGVLQREGAAILRYPSPRSGIILYDRYVSAERFCPSYQSLNRVSIPTADTAHCPVFECRQFDLGRPLGDD